MSVHAMLDSQAMENFVPVRGRSIEKIFDICYVQQCL